MRARRLLALLSILSLTALAGCGADVMAQPTATTMPVREWEMLPIQREGDWLVIQVRFYSTADLTVTMDGSVQPDEVRPPTPPFNAASYVFKNLMPGQHTVHLSDVVGHEESHTFGFPEIPEVPLGESATLGVNDEIRIPGEELWVKFVGVTADSRCAIDVECVRAGEAVLKVASLNRTGTIDEAEVTYEVGANSSAELGDMNVAVSSVMPAPVSTKPIQPHEYEITLTVTRP